MPRPKLRKKGSRLRPKQKPKQKLQPKLRKKGSRLRPKPKQMQKQHKKPMEDT